MVLRPKVVGLASGVKLCASNIAGSIGLMCLVSVMVLPPSCSHLIVGAAISGTAGADEGIGAAEPTRFGEVVPTVAYRHLSHRPAPPASFAICTIAWRCCKNVATATT